MNMLIDFIKTFFERHAFGVCEWLGERFHIQSARIRMFFVYASFLTIGSPFIVYLVLAFWLDLRKLVSRPRRGVWDL